VLDLVVYGWAVFSWLNVKPAEMEKLLAKLEEPYEAPTEEVLDQHTRQLKATPRRKRKVVSKGLFER